MSKKKATSKALAYYIYLGLLKRTSSAISISIGSDIADTEALIACMWVAFNIFIKYEDVRLCLLLFYAMDRQLKVKPKDDEEVEDLSTQAQEELYKRFAEYDKEMPSGFGLGSTIWPKILGNMQGSGGLELDIEATFPISVSLMKLKKELVGLRDRTEITG